MTGWFFIHNWGVTETNEKKLDGINRGLSIRNAPAPANDGGGDGARGSIKGRKRGYLQMISQKTILSDYRKPRPERERLPGGVYPIISTEQQ